MTTPQTTKDAAGHVVHYSAGAIIKRDGKYLLIDRAIPPYGYAGIAGHVDEGETPEEALAREVREESGLIVRECTRTHEELLPWNTCSKGVSKHYWYLFRCAVEGVPERSLRETKSIGWFTPEEIQRLTLEPAWRYWFEKLAVI